MTGSSKKRRSAHLFRWLFLLIIIVVLCVVGVLGNYMVNYSLGRRQIPSPASVLSGRWDALFASAPKKQASRFVDCTLEKNGQVIPEEKVQTYSEDGLKLAAGVFWNMESHRWVIMLHGYRGNHSNVLNYSKAYYAAGYNVLAPDHRAHGGSEGAYIGMGWSERRDMVQWIDWILDTDPQAVIVMHGVSMGAATVMMTSGEKLPEAVAVFIEDCGYTSVLDIMTEEIQEQFHMPTFPMLPVGAMIAWIRTGLNYYAASSVEQLKKCTRPMLFIHGEKDNKVPYRMLQQVYDAKAGDNKQMLSVPKAGHVQSMAKLGQEYWNQVFGFIDQYIS